MRLLPRRGAGATLTVAPSRPMLPTESVTATATLDEQLADATAARIEIGYVNTYRYEWARAGHNSPGGYRDAEDWVAAVSEPIAFAGGTLLPGSYSATLRIPSWAPPTAASAVRWVARLVVERKGKVPRAEATFVVLAPAPDPLPEQLRQVQNEHAVTTRTRLDLRTEVSAYRLGSEVRGFISVTPTVPVTRTANAAIWFYRPQISHPLERNPSPRLESWTRPRVTVAEELSLVEGVATEIPFAVRLPDDGEPTLEAVHSSLEWWVEATITFAGLTGGIEKVRREIVVHNA